jgi:hypothetical protein
VAPPWDEGDLMSDELTPEEAEALADSLAGPPPKGDGIAEIAAEVVAEDTGDEEAA